MSGIKFKNHSAFTGTGNLLPIIREKINQLITLKNSTDDINNRQIL